MNALAMVSARFLLLLASLAVLAIVLACADTVPVPGLRTLQLQARRAYEWLTPGIAWLFVVWSIPLAFLVAELDQGFATAAPKPVVTATAPKPELRAAWEDDLADLLEHPKRHAAEGSKFDDELRVTGVKYTLDGAHVQLNVRKGSTTAWELLVAADLHEEDFGLSPDRDEPLLVSGAGATRTVWHALKQGPFARTYLGIQEGAARIVTSDYLSKVPSAGMFGLTAFLCNTRKLPSACWNR